MSRFRSSALAAAAVFGFASMASAADLPVKAPAYRFGAPLYNWNGFYIGLNLGGSWGHQDLLIGTVSPDGIIGGGQVGYNWQVEEWVLGLEADFQASGQKADGSFSTAAGIVPATSTTFTDKLNWVGTIRGRIGYAMGPAGSWLPYVTGGWAWGHSEISGTTTDGVTAVSFSETQNYSSGWTVGAGVEWAFADCWTGKFEYLYIDLGEGPTIANLVSGKMTDNIVRAGVNYKF